MQSKLYPNIHRSHTKIASKAFHSQYSRKLLQYYKQRFHLLMLNKGEETSLYRKCQTRGCLQNQRWSWCELGITHSLCWRSRVNYGCDLICWRDPHGGRATSQQVGDLPQISASTPKSLQSRCRAQVRVATSHVNPTNFKQCAIKEINPSFNATMDNKGGPHLISATHITIFMSHAAHATTSFAL